LFNKGNKQASKQAIQRCKKKPREILTCFRTKNIRSERMDWASLSSPEVIDSPMILAERLVKNKLESFAKSKSLTSEAATGMKAKASLSSFRTAEPT